MMGTNTKITCDGCGKDLSDFGAMPDYYLHLSPVRGKNSGGIVYAVCCYPDIEKSMDFCGLVCLGKWLNNKQNAHNLPTISEPKGDGK
jgi:hypothetical protein